MNRDNLLICIFSYNMGVTLDNCFAYLDRFCKGFDVVLMDDGSTDPATIAAIERWRHRLKEVRVNTVPKQGKLHGNLYDNIQSMCTYGTDHGYRYLMMIQDDMQFVRPLSEDVLAQYQALFDANEKVIQVDPRFLREGEYEVLPALRAYRYDSGTAYADVGITDLVRLKESGWTLKEGERVNKQGLAELGYQRYFPFSPVVMHVPFPQRYRNGKLRRSLVLLNRGKYGYHAMSEQDMKRMDQRDLAEYPHFKKFLRIRNMIASSIFYYSWKDSAILG